jgi:hypothetical protein
MDKSLSEIRKIQSLAGFGAPAETPPVLSRHMTDHHLFERASMFKEASG